MTTQITIHESKEVDSVQTFISQAIEKNLPVETMEKLFSLMERAKDAHAKSEYHYALSAFQAVCPVIEKTKVVNGKDGKERYRFAPIDSIVEQIKKPLGDNGLSYTFTTGNKEGFIVAIVKITHVLGYSESSEFEIPIDKEAYMSKQQQYAAALTYAKRYALCNALGISTGDEDNDGKGDSENKGQASVEVSVCKERLERASNEEQLKSIWKDELTPDERKNTEVIQIFKNHSKFIKGVIASEAKEQNA